MSAPHERLEVDREDLLAEASALVERIELQVEAFAEPIVIGFRKNRGTSVYFGADPAYHFNAAGELRRAYCGGLLYKADGRRLASLDRKRTGTAVVLLRHDLDVDEQLAFLERISVELLAVRDAVAAGRFVVRGQVSSGGDVLVRTREWLAEIRLPPMVARRPHAD